MAGVKVTDLPNLSTADAADIFYIVDSSANQSKQVDLTTIAAALNTLLSYVPLRGTAYTGIGQVTGDIEVDVAAGGVMTLRFPNGDIIGLGADYGGYSALSFFDATANETIYAYIRGGDIYFQNADTLGQVQGIINEITSLNSGGVFGSQIQVENQGHDGAIRLLNYSGDSIYWGSFASGRVGWKKLTQYYAKYSALITQTSTNAPVEAAVIESDFNNIGCTATYAWTFIGTGHYHLTINGTIIPDKWIVNLNKTIVRITNGQSTNVNYSTELVSSGVNTLQISIKTANPQTGNLTNGLMTRTLVEVEFYV